MSDFCSRFKDQVRSNFNISRQEYIHLESKHDFYGNLTDELLDYIFRTGLMPSGLERQPLSILDVGCGIGNSTKRLRERFPEAEIFGLDLSPVMLEAAKAQCPGIRFVCGDGESLPDYFPPESFDLVIYPASLFIMPQQERSLQQTRQLLKEGGVVAASIIRGLRANDDAQINALCGLPGIVKNDRLMACLEELFSDVGSCLIRMPVAQTLLRDLYSVPALLAGLFPKLSPQGRLTKLDEFLCEVKERKLELLQEWVLITALRDHKSM